MIEKLYRVLYRTKNKRGNLFVYRTIKLFLNMCYPIYCRISRKYTPKKIEENVIVSLTTFPQRIDTVWVTIETLLRQSYRPSRIILWLAESQFSEKDKLPKKLLEQKKRGLEIRFCDDLRSHKKYYYTMKHYPNSVVITVDDDTFYPENLVENLVETSNMQPNTVCCNLGHVITTRKGMIEPYNNWYSGADGLDTPSYNLVPIGCEGVLYPPKCLDENVFDKNQIKELCPLADDLWLKSMATLNGVKAIKCNPVSITYANQISAKKGSLNSVNVDQNMNDKQLEKILKKYPELKNVWRSEVINK